MRRAPVVLAATVAGLAAVLTFHPHKPALPQVATAAASGTGSGSGGSGGRTVTGDAVSTIYGTTQVRVTISGDRITGVQALQLPQGDPRSYAISATAEPMLRQSALARQSAAIDAVSGATYTSESYAASLQSALDRAGFGG